MYMVTNNLVFIRFSDEQKNTSTIVCKDLILELFSEGPLNTSANCFHIRNIEVYDTSFIIF